MTVFNITDDNFKEEVLASKQPVLVDFWAPWCGPCKMISPMLEEIATEYPDVKVGKVNIDEQEKLAIQFKIMTIPSLLVFKEGKVQSMSVGVKPKAEIVKLISE